MTTQETNNMEACQFKHHHCGNILVRIKSRITKREREREKESVPVLGNLGNRWEDNQLINSDHH